MGELVEIGTVSSRGQIAVPVQMRKEMGLEDSSKIIFFLEGDVLSIKKVTPQTWAQITKPFRQQKKKISQEDVNGLVHRMRKK